MGLGLLLTVSKTFRAARDMPHRYRTSSRARLPIFEGQFGTEHCAAAMKAETENAGKPADEAGAPTMSRTSRGEQPGSGSGAQAAPKQGAARRWWQIASWFSSGRGRQQPPAAARAIRSNERPPVQQELALENLKPCRNDLSDADWELAKQPVSGAKLAFLKNLASGGGGEGRSRTSRAAAPCASEGRR